MLLLWPDKRVSWAQRLEEVTLCIRSQKGQFAYFNEMNQEQGRHRKYGEMNLSWIVWTDLCVWSKAHWRASNLCKNEKSWNANWPPWNCSIASQSRNACTYWHIQCNLCWRIQRPLQKGLIAACVRFMHNGNLKERAVRFVAAEDRTSSGIADKTLEILKPLQLDSELCVCFSFDKVSSCQVGELGCKCCSKNRFPLAVYVYCYSPCFNLVLSTASKVSHTVSTFSHVLKLLHHFLTGANRHTISTHPKRASL